MSTDAGRRFSRREALGGAASVAAAGVIAAADANASLLKAGRRRRAKPTVAVLGGGVGGLTAAHELAERGFDVTVYERRALGGKARSYGVPGSAAGGRRPLPAEHGFRFFPGFYRNLPETMARIPYGSNPNGTLDNLVSVPQLMFARSGGRADPILPMNLDGRHWTPEQFRDSAVGAFDLGARVPPHELGHFGQRLLVFFTSCDNRRFGQWEDHSWWDFIGASGFSEEYDRVIANNVTRQILAAKADAASARTMGLMMEALVYTFAGPEGTRDYARVLNGPTNEAFVDPWIEHLRGLGVRFRVGQTVEALALRHDRITAARVRDARGRRRRVEADWFVCALPMERARRLWSPAILRADPRLEQMRELTADWLTGFQFYLREPTPILHGLGVYVDSEWGLGAISQQQFWDRDFARDYGDGRVSDCLSVDIGAWGANGAVYGRPARSLKPAQIAREVWQQIKDHVNDTGEAKLSDDLVVSWSLDSGIGVNRRTGKVASNADPLFINRKSSWQRRPGAGTRISNLVLAADYVQMDVDVACMEGANEAGRRAVNSLLERAGSRAEPCTLFELYEPSEWRAFKRMDEELYRRGQPNLFDRPWHEVPESIRSGVVPPALGAA